MAVPENHDPAPIGPPAVAASADLGEERFQFPPWANYLFPAMLLLAIGVLTYLPLLGTLALSPKTRSVGYRPEQPVAFSHALHAGELGMDCRFCHTTVEETAFAAVPPTKTCLNCHAAIKAESDLLQPVRASFETGEPIRWVKVHDMPDFVYFNHSAHVNKGVGCETCHGRVDRMEEVGQDKPLGMAWCLECHRQPEKFLRPRDAVTAMGWDAFAATGKSQSALGAELKETYHVLSEPFMTSCTTCHR